MNLWFNNKKNAVLALRRLFRDGVDMKQFDRSEVRVEPVADPAARGPSRVTKSYRQGQGWQEQRHESGLGYHLVLPRPLSTQHMRLLLKWASQQPGGRPQGYGFAHTTQIIDSVLRYTDASGMINNALRRGGRVIAEKAPSVAKAIVRETRSALDSALKVAIPLVRQRVFYRGVPFTPKVGQTYTDRAFMSTSLSPRVAGTFAPAHGAVIRIVAPPGTKVLFPSRMTENRPHPINAKKYAKQTGEPVLKSDMAMYEAEAILPRNTAIRILSQDGPGKFTAEVVGSRGMGFSRSESEKSSLYNWRKGRAYVNDALLKKAYVYEPPRLKEEIRNMDGMLQRQKPLVRPVTVYRGVGARIEHKVGDVFKMPQYVSTTRSKYVAATVFTNVARHVYNERHGYKEGYDTKAPNGTFYRIICVPGTRVLNPGNDKIAELKGGSMQELILPRGQEFRVVSKDGVNAYTLETIPQQGYSFAFQSSGPRVANPLPVHPTLTPEERFKLAEHAAKIFNRDDAPHGRLRRLRLSQLRSIQPTVDAETVRSYTHRRKPLKVAKVQGHWTVLDGNHCAARCWHARDKHVAVEEFAVD